MEDQIMSGRQLDAEANAESEEKAAYCKVSSSIIYNHQAASVVVFAVHRLAW